MSRGGTLDAANDGVAGPLGPGNTLVHDAPWERRDTRWPGPGAVGTRIAIPG